MKAPNQLERAIESMMRSVEKAKSDWLSKQMERIMPPEVYALSKTDKGSDRMKLAKWMLANKVSLREYPPTLPDPNTITNIREELNKHYNKSELVLANKVISLFSYRIHDFRLEAMTKDFPI